ncbi:MAG: chemotaxis protein CheW [Syntrophales bacterium]|nr:chemotaxis protein CheW [Syntrophales bacterium]
MNESFEEKLNRGNHIEANRKGMYLIFSLGGWEFGIDLLRVKEVLGVRTLMSASETLSNGRKTIHRRGEVMPVVDLGLALGIEAASYTDLTSIIVADVQSGNGKAPVAIIVDSLSEAIIVSSEEISKEAITGIPRADYIVGLAKSGGQEKILLNIDKVLESEETLFFSHAA